MKRSYEVVQKMELETVNRGKKSFLIGTANGKYFAHELGELTQWARVTGREEYTSHRLNPTKRYGNQYGKYFVPMGYATAGQAKNRCIEIANSAIQYF